MSLVDISVFSDQDGDSSNALSINNSSKWVIKFNSSRTKGHDQVFAIVHGLRIIFKLITMSLEQNSIFWAGESLGYVLHYIDILGGRVSGICITLHWYFRWESLWDMHYTTLIFWVGESLGYALHYIDILGGRVSGICITLHWYFGRESLWDMHYTTLIF